MPPSNSRARARMMFDLPLEMQMAIRLRAIKSNTSTADVICEAMRSTFANDLKEAETILADQDHQSKPGSRKRTS